MTATLITTDEVHEQVRNAEFRLSERQRDMLRTLNTLLDELSPAPVANEDLVDLWNPPRKPAMFRELFAIEHRRVS